MNYEHDILWVSPFEEGTIDDPPIKAQQIFESNGLLYRRLSFDRPIWDDSTRLLNNYFPDLFYYVDYNNYNYKFETRLEFKENLWAYVLYIIFDNEAEFVHFMMWFKSQKYSE